MKSKSKIMSILAPVIAILVVAGVWELLVRVMQVSEKLIPAPSAIVASLIENFGDVIAPDLVISIQNILIGYLVAVPVGFLISAICSQFKIVTKAVTPILIILMITPMSTLVPIFKLNLGATAP